MPNSFYYHYEHSRLRAFQRYDLRLDKRLFSKFNKAIRHGLEKLGRIDVYRLDSLTPERELYKVRYKNKNYIVVYCKRDEFIVTFLPETARELQN